MEAKPRRFRRGWDTYVGLAAAVLLVVMVVSALLPTSDDDAPSSIPDERDISTRDAVVVAPSEAAPDRVTVQAQGRPDAGAPWLGFEVCAAELPGCAPLWTYSLRQDGASYTAEVRLPPNFVAPDSVRHDCDRPGACVMRVTTATTSVNHDIVAPAGPSTAGSGTAEVPSSGPELGVALGSAPTAGASSSTISVTGGASTAPVEIRICAQSDLDDYCKLVHIDRTDADGVSSFELVLPRRIAGVAESAAGMVRTETDCAREVCRLMVEVSGARTEISMPLDPAAAPPPVGDVRLSNPGPFDANEDVIIEGREFPTVSPTRSALVRWVFCDEQPDGLATIGQSCGSPRTVRAAAIDGDGSFSLPVRVPPPDTVRTWVDNRPVGCDQRCWLVVLAEPFPSIVTVPIEIRAPDQS